MNQFFYNILGWINSWVGSWGVAMILFTIMIRLVLTPLDIKSRMGMRRTQELQPQLQALQKKYANDKEKLNAKTAELYKKAHVNPLSSCLPMLLSWPILIIVFGAMRMAANEQLLGQLTQILRLPEGGATPVLEPFLWIKNLWMPDNFFSSAYPDISTLRVIPSDQWLKWFEGLQQSGVPKMIQDLGLTVESFDNKVLADTVTRIVNAMTGNIEGIQGIPAYIEAVATIPGFTVPLVNWSVPRMFNGFLLLPILSAVSQIAMTKIMGNGQPQAEGQGAGAGKFMQWFFPIFSLWICLGYSAAFALYWVAGNLVSMGQTYAINKYLDSKEKKAAPVAGEGSVK